MNNNFIHSLNNTYQLTVDEKTIPFNVSITDIGDDKISKLREKNIKRLKKEDKIINWLFCIPMLVLIAMSIITMIAEMIFESSILYHIFICIGCILGFYGVIIMICKFFSGLFLDMHINGIKGWNAYQTASEIAFALDNIESDSKIKLIKDVVKQTNPDIYLQIKDNDTKRINTYWLDDFSWDVHNKDEVILTANSTEINDIKSTHPVYEMKLLVPQWLEDEYIVGRNLLV